MQNENKQIFSLIEERENFKIRSSSSLSGGSINDVYLLETSAGLRVVKLNKTSRFPGMFEAEQEGLQALGSAQTIDVPKPLSFGQSEDTAYLLLEYKPEGKPVADFWDIFARNLAALHKNTAENFGFKSNNYIGSLPQYNQSSSSAADFYISQRLEPQLKMAAEKGFTFKNIDNILRNISSNIPDEPPALIHGDLWSGNYLVNQAGLPCLIDPAVCYGPREMDLSMMKLFGGFKEEVFDHYHSYFPLEAGFADRVPIWQLYYLLVHLNIFGSSYLPGVQNILGSFSR